MVFQTGIPDCSSMFHLRFSEFVRNLSRDESHNDAVCRVERQQTRMINTVCRRIFSSRWENAFCAFNTTLCNKSYCKRAFHRAQRTHYTAEPINIDELVRIILRRNVRGITSFYSR